jgi:hypothetical protein
MSVLPPVSSSSATAVAISATDNSSGAQLWAIVAVSLSTALAGLLSAATFAQAALRAQGPFPLSAVAESWRPRALRAWRPYFVAHALLAVGALAGAAAPLAPWAAGWVRLPAAAGPEGAAYARGYYLILSGLWGSWRSCVVDLAVYGPKCSEGVAPAPRLLLGACAALHAVVVFFCAPAVAMSALATMRVASVAGGAAPLDGRDAGGGGGRRRCCAPAGAPAVAAVTWAAAGGAWAASGVAWGARRALKDLVVADAATAASALGADAGGAGVGAGGALAAVACACLTLGAALATWTGYRRVGHIPGLGASRTNACCVEHDELLHETDPDCARGGKQPHAAGDRAATALVVGVQDSSIYEMY